MFKKNKPLKTLRIILFICLATIMGKVGVSAMATYRVEGKSIIVNAPNPADFCEAINFIEEYAKKGCKHLVVEGVLDIQDFNYFDLTVRFSEIKILDISGLKNQEFPSSYLERNKLEELVLPKNMKTIPCGMCYLCEKLKTVVLPKKLEAIGDGAFVGCEKLILKIPKNVKIGKRVGYDSPGVELPISPSCTLF